MIKKKKTLILAKISEGGGWFHATPGTHMWVPFNYDKNSH